MKFVITLIFFALISCAPQKHLTQTETNTLIATEVCSKLYPIAYSAITNKNNGVSYKTMNDVLPSLTKLSKSKDALSKFVGLNMHEIVEEVYGFETLDSNIYSTYRSEKCFYNYNGKHLKYGYDKIHPILLSCQNGDTTNYINCAMKVVKESLE